MPCLLCIDSRVFVPVLAAYTLGVALPLTIAVGLVALLPVLMFTILLAHRDWTACKVFGEWMSSTGTCALGFTFFFTLALCGAIDFPFLLLAVAVYTVFYVMKGVCCRCVCPANFEFEEAPSCGNYFEGVRDLCRSGSMFVSLLFGLLDEVFGDDD